MLFSVYLILFASTPYFFEKIDGKDKNLHFIFTFFFIYLLSVLSANGPDITTYQKNYFENGEQFVFKPSALIFNAIIYYFNRLDLSFFIYQLFIKSIFCVGLYIFIKNLYKKNLEYIFAIIFACIYLVPIISINSLYQSAALGLFLIIVSFKNFNLLRDLPIIFIMILMHKSGFAGLILYSLSYAMQFRRIKKIKKFQVVILSSLLIFSLFYFWNLDFIKETIYQKLYILDDPISHFQYVWLLLLVFLSILFFISKKKIKRKLSYKDYNFLISSIIYLIFIFFIFLISKQYALRFFYYEFVFFMIMVSLIPNMEILNYEKFKNYFIITYILGALFFVSFWNEFANEKKAFNNYKIFSDIRIFCKQEQKCNMFEYKSFDLIEKIIVDYPEIKRQY
jgi:hypothetical protein